MSAPAAADLNFNSLISSLKDPVQSFVDANIKAKVAAATRWHEHQVTALERQVAWLNQELLIARDAVKQSQEQVNKTVADAVEMALSAERARRQAASSAALESAVKVEPSPAPASTEGVVSGAATSAAGASSSAAPLVIPGFINVSDSLQYTSLGSYQRKPVFDLYLSAPEVTGRGGKWLTCAEEWTIGGPGIPRPIREYSSRTPSGGYENRQIIGEEYVRLDCSVEKFRALYPGADRDSLKKICERIRARASAAWQLKFDADRKAKGLTESQAFEACLNAAFNGALSDAKI